MYSREPGSALSLGSVGTRRTVYLSEDEPPQPSAQAPGKSTPPLLIYNRISTVIGEPARSSTAPAPGSTVTGSNNVEETSRDLTSDRKKNDATKENAIWYEYGCV